jgi:acyl-CoA thioesterase FadM
MKPMIYDATTDIRFSDLDLYKHVNSKHYIDFVSTSRLVFMKKCFDLSMESFAEKGYGFYLTKSIVNYKRPIVGLQSVRTKSFVEEFIGNKILKVRFDMMTEDETKSFADGYLEFTVVDLKNNRAVNAPDWFLEYFYE